MNVAVETCLAAFMGAAGKAGADYFIGRMQFCYS
jgi:hypothetical protein